MAFDLVIRNGIVIDGTGHPRFRADVAVRDGVVAEVGRVDDRGAREIDAEGLFVTPGFVDSHVHLDAQVNWDPLGPTARHGVTTAVMGNCGYSVAPCREADKDVVFSIFERAEDIPPEALEHGVEWRWETFTDWLDHLRRLPKGINYATQVGHSALRAYVMGERAYDEGAADEDDVATMCRALHEAIAAGAIGFSTNRSPVHVTRDDRPVPSRQATWEEIGALIGVLGRLGHGSVQMNDHGERESEAWHRQLIDWALATGRPFFARGVGAVGGAGPIRDLYDEGDRRGARLFGFWFAKPFDTVTGFRSRLAFDTLPSWQAVRSLPLEEQRRIFTDPVRRAELVHDAMTKQSGTEVAAGARQPKYDILEVLTEGVGPYKTVGQVAEERGTTPVDAMIDLSLESDFHQLFSQDLLHEAGLQLTPEYYRTEPRSPYAVWGVSDAGAHLSQSLGFDQTTHFLARTVRDEGVFSWEEAIRLLAFVPACAWGFADRGLVRPGWAADLVVFDPDALDLPAPTIEHDLPGGAPRLKRDGLGYHHTIVNGVEVLRANQPTGEAPGRVLPGSGRPAL